MSWIFSSNYSILKNVNKLLFVTLFVIQWVCIHVLAFKNIFFLLVAIETGKMHQSHEGKMSEVENDGREYVLGGKNDWGDMS